MDIQLASNFERYLFYLYDENPERVKSAFAELKEHGCIKFSAEEMKRVRSDFCSASVGQAGTLETIGSFFKETGYLLDPHTAVGVRAAQELLPKETSRICLATAHPAKFGEVVEKAVGQPATQPPSIAALEGLPSRCELMDADLEKVRAFVIRNAG
jgi:threonine synthase